MFMDVIWCYDVYILYYILYIYVAPPPKKKTMSRAKTVVFTVFHAHDAL